MTAERNDAVRTLKLIAKAGERPENAKARSEAGDST